MIGIISAIDINSHKCSLPTGVWQTYPNVLSQGEWIQDASADI